MLTFRHKAAASPVEGLGLFTLEDLAKDTVLWVFVPGYDIALTETEFAALPGAARDYMLHYGWKDADDGLWHISVDGDKYTNHSATPNTYKDSEGRMLALVDIPAGTEILSNYDDFDRMIALKLAPTPPPA